jgi:hypothetical protein
MDDLGIPAVPPAFSSLGPFRWFKMMLNERITDRIFLDSDDVTPAEQQKRRQLGNQIRRLGSHGYALLMNGKYKEIYHVSCIYMYIYICNIQGGDPVRFLSWFCSLIIH